MPEGAAPPMTSGEERTFYVINLCAAPVPLPLEMPADTGLEGLVVFRSHEVQDGRHRYRLHLGYFESRAAAREALLLIQPRYPTAWIAAAPRSRLGSLDDTGSTDFRLIQAPASGFSSFSSAEHEPPPPAVKPVAAPPVEEPQRYAVQLVWSSDRSNPADLPPIALFDAYTLYTVTCQRGGVRLYGVRLGFFRSAISASQVAVYVRPDFPTVAVVPVSDREFAYASWLVRHRGPQEPSVGRAPRVRLEDEPSPAAPPVATVDSVVALTDDALADDAPADDADPAGAPVTAGRATAADAARRHVPTQVEIAQIRSPDEVPLAARESSRPEVSARETAPSRHWAHTAHRPPDMDKEARLAALGAHEIKLRAARFDPQDKRDAALPEERPYRSHPFGERRSVLKRLLTRITDRLG